MTPLSANLTLSFEHPINAYALVIGGYFPLSLAFNDVLLIDRNILGVLSCVSGQSSRHDAEINRWWLSYLNRSDRKINPVLCAIEGSIQSTPSYEEFSLAFDDACIYIQEHLPNAQLVSLDEKARQAAYATVESTAERHQKELGFLVECAPLLAHRTAKANLSRKENALFAQCSNYGLEHFSLPFIAALSCLYEPRNGDRSIGRGIIKPSMSYSVREAHNTLSDLRALEMLVLGNSLGIGSTAFCTRDKALAAFWCSLKFQSVRWYKNTAEVNFRIDRSLFPALTPSQYNELHQRIIQRTSNN